MQLRSLAIGSLCAASAIAAPIISAVDSPVAASSLAVRVDPAQILGMVGIPRELGLDFRPMQPARRDGPRPSPFDGAGHATFALVGFDQRADRIFRLELLDDADTGPAAAEPDAAARMLRATDPGAFVFRSEKTRRNSVPQGLAGGASKARGPASSLASAGPLRFAPTSFATETGDVADDPAASPVEVVDTPPAALNLGAAIAGLVLLAGWRRRAV